MITVEELLEKIRIASKIPKDQLEDDSLLSIATDILYTRLTSQIISTHENYYRQEDTKTIGVDDYVYRFPTAAIGGGLLDVLWKNNAASEEYYSVRQYEVSDKTRSRRTMGFILTNGGLEIWPRIGGSRLLVVYYLLRPGKLQKAINTAKVVDTNTTNGTIELSVLPGAFTVGSYIDIMKSDGLAERVVVNALIDGVSGSVISLSDESLVASASVGDTVAVTTYSPYAQLPDEYIDYFVALICQKIAQVTGDDRLYQMATKNIKDSKPDVLNIVNPRVSEEVSSVNIDWD